MLPAYFFAFFTGVCYAYGTGINKNEAEAARLYRLAADQCHSDAQYHLGKFFLSSVFLLFNCTPLS